MSNPSNKRKDKFLASIPTASLDADEDTITLRSKFNFSYFCHQPAGQNFEDWTAPQLAELFHKLKEFSKLPLAYWENQRCGAGGLNVLCFYGAFPSKTEFTYPKEVPHQACWGRFRLGNKVRLIGFKIPSEYQAKLHTKTGKAFDTNTFYVVFLDREHRFYKTGEAD